MVPATHEVRASPPETTLSCGSEGAVMELYKQRTQDAHGARMGATVLTLKLS